MPKSKILPSPGETEAVVLVHIEFTDKDSRHEYLQEFEELARSAGANVVSIVTGKRETPDAKYFAGSGKIAEILEQVNLFQANLVIFNHDLSPSQERNIEKFLQCRVLDRTGLILDIFAQRARSFEGQLQVELAQLNHLATRLVRGWTHLERQKGGIGLRGPGETQLEVDRRLVRNRIDIIKARLEKVRAQRELSRRARRRARVPTIALVGYTNAGKSTLFNRLTKADVYVADKLFATLDPTLRRIELPVLGNVILADTVGFLRHLPHHLIDAFRATLEETKDADLLLHVVDCSDDMHLKNIEAVDVVLRDIDAFNVPHLHVYNKIDLLDGVEPHIDYLDDGSPSHVFISARDEKGLDLLFVAIKEILAKGIEIFEVKLTPKEGKLRALLYKKNAVIAEHIDNEGNMHLSLAMTHADFRLLFKDKR